MSGLRNLLKRQNLLRRAGIKALALVNSLHNALHGKIYDCYFEPNFILLPTIRARRTILTAHDFSCFLYPQWHPAERVRHMEKFFLASLERADCIITVSEAMRSEAMETFGLAPKRVQTIHNGVDHSFFRPLPSPDLNLLRRKYALPGDFILHVGTVEPRKNLHNLLQAHAALPQTLRARFPLLLVGATGWNNAEIHHAINAMASHVRLLGYVPQADLPALYGTATLLAYPSWYEGFGLPVLEAMACGCPVITSTHAALREVSGEAALHAPPDDVDALAASLREMLEDAPLRQRLRLRGLERAALFSWEKSAQKHLELFNTLCAT